MEFKELIKGLSGADRIQLMEILQNDDNIALEKLKKQYNEAEGRKDSPAMMAVMGEIKKLKKEI